MERSRIKDKAESPTRKGTPRKISLKLLYFVEFLARIPPLSELTILGKKNPIHLSGTGINFAII